MRSDVHSAALRAAAKVAFSVAFITGCSSPSDVDGDNNAVDNVDGVEPGTSEADITTAKKPSKAAQLASGCHTQKDAGAPKLTCEQIVNAAFPTEGNYPGTKKTV